MKKRKRTIVEKNNQNLLKMKTSCGGKDPHGCWSRQNRAKSGRKKLSQKKKQALCVLCWPGQESQGSTSFCFIRIKGNILRSPHHARWPSQQCQTWTLISRTFQPTCGGKDNTGVRGEDRNSKVGEAGEHRATEGKPGVGRRPVLAQEACSDL